MILMEIWYYWRHHKHAARKTSKSRNKTICHNFYPLNKNRACHLWKHSFTCWVLAHTFLPKIFYLALGASPINHFWTHIFWETRLSSESLEPLIGFPTYLGPKFNIESAPPLSLPHIGHSKVGWIVGAPFYLDGLLPIPTQEESHYDYHMHIGILCFTTAV